jgi:cytoskeletal protein RodZ
MSLEQIGQKLKSARESRNLSFGQVYDRTKIPTNHLEAIELGHLDDLPEPVYVSGFIKRYADFLGLNGQALAEEYKLSNQTSSENSRGGLFHRGAAVQQISAPVSYVSKVRVDTESPGFAKTFFYPSLLVIFTIGVVCSLAAWYQGQLASQTDPGVLALRESASRFNTQGVAVPLTAPPALNTPPVPTESKISLTASSHVWLEVTAMSSGAPLFSGYLERGDRRDFQDPQGLKVRSGNGASITVDYQGNKEAFGPAGKPLTREFNNPSFNATANATAAATSTTGSTTVDATARPAAIVKRVVRRSTDDASSSHRSAYRRFDGGSRAASGEGSGAGARSIDVPYRYTD